MSNIIKIHQITVQNLYKYLRILRMCGVWMACACKACCSSGGHAAKQGLAPQLGPSNKGP